MDLCKYKDIFGKANTGIHSKRIFETKNFKGFAFYDILFTVIGAVFIAFIIKRYKNKNTISFSRLFIYCLLFLFLLGYILHKFFCVY